jgi:hypothetical protein
MDGAKEYFDHKYKSNHTSVTLDEELGKKSSGLGHPEHGVDVPEQNTWLREVRI